MSLYKDSLKSENWRLFSDDGIMLLNLFLSILMNNYQKDNDISLFEIEEKKKELSFEERKLFLSINNSSSSIVLLYCPLKKYL